MLNHNEERIRVWCIIIGIFLIIMLTGAFYWWQNCRPKQQLIDVDGILAQSVLQNKSFAAKVQNVQLKNMSAYLLEEHSVPLIYVSFAFQNAGAAHEEQLQQGITTILADMLTNGAGKYDALTFKNLCAEYGIKIGFSSDRDNFNGFLSVPSENLPRAIEIMRAVLYAPQFADKYLTVSKAQLQKAIEMQSEKPQAVLNDEFSAMFYAGHPYSRKALGETEQIAALQAADLRTYMQENLAQNNLLIGISGDITAVQAQDFMQQVFNDLPQQTKALAFSRLQIATEGNSYNIERNAAQSIVRFAVQGTYRDSADFYPLYLANYIFGESGLSSRLSKVIREQNGLTYGIYTFLNIKSASALLEGYFSVTPENVQKVQTLLQQEWQKMAAEGVTKQELQQAKKALLSAYHLRFSSLGAIADMLVSIQQYNLGQDFLQKRNDYIKAVTLEQVNAAARKYYTQKPDFISIGTKVKEH